MNVCNNGLLDLEALAFSLNISKWSVSEFGCIFKNIFSRSVDGISLAKELTSKNLFPHKQISKIERISDPAEREQLSASLLLQLNETYKKLKGSIGKANYFEPLPIMQIPHIVSEEERLKFWEKKSVLIRSNLGHLGVFLTSQPFVIKASEYPGRELLASRIFLHLGIPTPEVKEVPRSSAEGKAIESLLTKHAEYAKRGKPQSCTSFFLMSRIYGMNLEEISPVIADRSFLGNKSNYHAFLRQLSVIAAVDLFLGYQDRFSLTGLSNLGNIMLLCDKSSCIRTVVAVDQNVALSKRDIFSGKSHLGKMKNYLLEILEDQEAAMQPILNDLPEYFKKYENQKIALEILWSGFLSGLKLVLEKINKTNLLEMSKNCDRSSLNDQIDINDLIDLQDFLVNVYDEWSAKQLSSIPSTNLNFLFKFICNQEETKELVSKIETLHGSISLCYDAEISAPAQWNHSKKIISVRSIGGVIPNLLFEVLNASSEPLANLLGEISEIEQEDFVRQVETIEYEHLIRAKKILKVWKEKGFVETNPFEEAPLSLEEHLEHQIKSGHSKHLRDSYELCS